MGNPKDACFWYTRWFTAYDLVNYDIVFGKDWHEQMKHTVDDKHSVLTIVKCTSRGCDVRLYGLARDHRAEDQGLARSQEQKTQR